MKIKLRRRFWVETALGLVTGILCLLIPVWPDWIEIVSGWDPDHHDGSVEWALACGLLIATLTMSAAAATEWRRSRVAESS